MLHFTTGDMFETPVDIRVNTVNCVGVMGAGVALAFKTRYPAMFREYKKVCDAGDLKPGTLNVWRTLTEWVINFPTKRHWRENSRYEDIEEGLKALRQYLSSVGRPVRVALPALGCGHGGLDWSRVSKLIEHYLAVVEAEIFVFAPADSVRVGELAAARRKRNGDSPQDARPKSLRSDDKAFPAVLRDADIHSLTTVGDAARLVEPMVLVTLSETPDIREEEAALQCVEGLAGARVQLSFLVCGPLWHRLAKVAILRGAELLLWSIEPIQLHALQLENELNDGRVTVAYIANDNEISSQRTHQRIRQAALGIARAALITDSRPEWLLNASIIKGKRLFFVRYAATVSTSVDSLLKEVASPIGRNSDSKAPNVAPILAAVRRDATNNAASARPGPRTHISPLNLDELYPSLSKLLATALGVTLENLADRSPADAYEYFDLERLLAHRRTISRIELDETAEMVLKWHHEQVTGYLATLEAFVALNAIRIPKHFVRKKLLAPKVAKDIPPSAEMIDTLTECTWGLWLHDTYRNLTVDAPFVGANGDADFYVDTPTGGLWIDCISPTPKESRSNIADYIATVAATKWKEKFGNRSGASTLPSAIAITFLKGQEFLMPALIRDEITGSNYAPPASLWKQCPSLQCVWAGVQSWSASAQRPLVIASWHRSP